MEILDVIIVGAGPCGLACGIEAKKSSLNYMILEKGNITEAIRRYPVNMTFFSTSENLEIGDIPFTSVNNRPNRMEALKYYRKVSSYFQLNIKGFTEVLHVHKEAELFEVTTTKGSYKSKNIILATGYYDVPRLINVKGEDLPHVNHYFDEPFYYTNTKVMVVGGANSAIEAALDLYRNGADVCLVHMFNEVDSNVKYWILPDINNRIKKGEITAFFKTQVKEIKEGIVILYNLETGKEFIQEADFVFLMTGYLPDTKFLGEAGVEFEEDVLVPQLNPDTFESSVPGLYLAGSVVGGEETAKIFIENGKTHGKVIIQDIMNKSLQ